VLFRLVADNESVARALFMAVHLMNTFVLLACLTLLAHWCASDARPRLAPRRAWPLALAGFGLMLVGTSGAIAALGDTLYPSRSLLGGLAADVSPTAHFLVRLRVGHPLLALVGAIGVALVAWRVLRAGPDARTRRSAWTVTFLVLLQLLVGLANVALLAPVWMQLVHLLLADLVWMALVLMAVRALAADAARA
jgi:heme A synthase